MEGKEGQMSSMRVKNSEIPIESSLYTFIQLSFFAIFFSIYVFDDNAFYYNFLQLKEKRGFRVWMLLFCIGGISFMQKNTKLDLSEIRSIKKNLNFGTAVVKFDFKTRERNVLFQG